MERDISESTIAENYQDGTGSSKQSSEKSSISRSSDKTDLVHHVDDKVCNVELIPSQRRKLHNVMTRMKDAGLRGPLRVLQRCMMENIKVKVLTRNYKHVRGICTGYVLAFDKHWNLALKDVDEVYKNPIPRPQTRTNRKRKISKKIVESAQNTGILDNPKPNKDPHIGSRAVSSVVLSESEIHAEIDSEHRISSSLKILAHERKRIVHELQKLSCASSSSSESEEPTTKKSSAHCAKDRPDSIFVKESHLRKQTAKELQELSSKKSESSKQKDDASWSELDHNFFKSRRHCKNRNYVCNEKKNRAEIVDSVQNLKSDNSYHENNLSLSRQMQLDNKSCSNSSQQTLSSAEKTSKSHPRKSIRHCDSEMEHQDWLTRHVNQLFIRGDNVVLVSLLDG